MADLESMALKELRLVPSAYKVLIQHYYDNIENTHHDNLYLFTLRSVFEKKIL